MGHRPDAAAVLPGHVTAAWQQTFICQQRTVQSLLQDSSRSEGGSNATNATGPACPSNIRTSSKFCLLTPRQDAQKEAHDNTHLFAGVNGDGGVLRRGDEEPPVVRKGNVPHLVVVGL
jgi:hypothetical protein